MTLSPLSSGTWLPRHIVPILTLVVTAACGSDAPSNAPGLNQEAAGAEEARAVADDADPDGTLVVGDRTLTFEVRACDTGEEQDPDLPTLYGSGTTPEGERFNVHVDRSTSGTQQIHAVSFDWGDLVAGTGTSGEMLRTRFEGRAWQDLREGAASVPDEPLVQIDGRTVTAEGTFEVTTAGEASWQEGRLEATCPE